MVKIDGSIGEGGGQIIRTSLTLAALTQKEIKITNIRANRDNPGLRAQHITCARAVRKICRGELIGDELHSKELIFKPGKIVGGNYEFNVGTAGSTILVAQTILPILLFSNKKSKIKITGGTHAIKAPTYDYFENVFLRALTIMGAKIKSKLIRTGYYPKGGGVIELEIEPMEIEDLNPIENYPDDHQTSAIIRLGKLPKHIGIREKKVLIEHSMKAKKDASKIAENIKFIEENTLSLGNCVSLFNGLKGSCVLGKKGKRAEDVAKESIQDIELQLNFDVDYHLADQLLLYYSLIRKGKYSVLKITEHTKTNARIIEEFLDVKIKIEKNLVSIL